MSNCLNFRYVPLDPSLYGWKFLENWCKPILFEGIPLPHLDYAVDESEEVAKSFGMAEGSGTIIESGIVESEEAVFGESEDISVNYNGQEEHSASSQYTDSCNDSNDDADVVF